MSAIAIEQTCNGSEGVVECSCELGLWAALLAWDEALTIRDPGSPVPALALRTREVESAEANDLTCLNCLSLLS
jgi:hypothetical protein